MPNSITIVVQVDTSQGTAAVNAFNTNLANIGKTAAAASAQATAGLATITLNLNQANSAARQFTQTLSAMAAIRAGAELVTMADSINKAQIALTAMTGSAETAADIIGDVRELARKSPFSFPELAATSQRLVAFGFAAKEVPKTLETITNAAAALGKGKQGIDSITLALGQMKTKGIVQGQELFRQLAEQGVQGAKYLKEAIEKELGKGISEKEFRRYIEKGMVQAEPAIQVILERLRQDTGAIGEEMQKLVSVRFEKLKDELTDVALVLNKDLGPSVGAALDQIADLLKAFQELPEPVRKVIEVLALLAIGIEAVNAAIKVFESLRVIQLIIKFGGAIAGANPALAQFALWLGIIAGVIATIVATMKAGQALGGKVAEWFGAPNPENMKNAEQWLQTLKSAAALRNEMVKKGLKPAAEDLTGMSKEQLQREIQNSAEAINSANKERQKLLAANEEEAKHQNEIAQQILERSEARARGPIFGLGSHYAGSLRELAGNPAATAKAWEAMFSDLQVNIEAFQKKNREELNRYQDAQKKVADEELKYRSKQYEERLKFDQQTLEMGYKNAEAQSEFEIRIAQQDQDARLAMADQGQRHTLAAEIAYQKQVEQIKTETEEKIRALKLETLEIEFNKQLALLHAEERAKELAVDPDQRLAVQASYLQREYAMTEEFYQKSADVAITSQDKIDKARLDSTKNINNAIYAEQKKIYDSLKSSLGKVFDALLDKSTSVWEAMANSFKTAIIGAIKEIVTSRAAAALMQMFGYGSVSFGGGPRGLGGQQPVFGGGAGGGGRSILGSLLGVGSMGGAFGAAGAPGGTSGFAGPVQSVMMPGGGVPYSMPVPTLPGIPSGGGGGAGGAASQLGLLASLKGLFGIGAKGSVATGAGSATTWGAGLGSKLSIMGHSTGAALLGAGLFAAGMYKGGAAGIGMTTAGGAMLGFKFGGPLGAAIGAAAGFTAGLLRTLLIKGADQKVREKVQAVYGIDIKEKNIRLQIADIAKQKYGGNLDLAIRSQEVRELVNLYAVSQGTQAAGMPRQMYAATFAQSGTGGPQLQTVYNNGQAVANPYTGVTTSQWNQAATYVQLNPQMANDLFEGRVVNVMRNNPADVAQASADGTTSGSARNAQRASLVEPLTVVS